MARRTIAEARRILEQDLAPVVNDHVRRQYETEINAAAGKAKAVADRMLNQIVHSMQEQRDEVLAEVCALRDDFQALTDEGALGTLSANEYHDRLKELQTRQRALSRKEQELVGMADRAASIEEDPEAYGDALFAKFPANRPDFTF